MYLYATNTLDIDHDIRNLSLIVKDTTLHRRTNDIQANIHEPLHGKTYNIIKK